MQFFKTLLDIIFPPRCEVCRSIGPEPFCEDCISKISYLTPSAFIHSIGIYEGPLKKAIRRFKFKKRRRLIKPLGRIMARYLKKHLNVQEIDIFVPIPLHENKQRSRGFNQAELLSFELTRNFDIPTVSGLLFRIKETHQQFDLPRKERFKNVKGAFEVKGSNFLSGKNLLLIDDIYTTGSTVAECTRVLKDAGAGKIHVLTLSCALEG